MEPFFGRLQQSEPVGLDAAGGVDLCQPFLQGRELALDALDAGRERNVLRLNFRIGRGAGTGLRRNEALGFALADKVDELCRNGGRGGLALGHKKGA